MPKLSHPMVNLRLLKLARRARRMSADTDPRQRRRLRRALRFSMALARTVGVLALGCLLLGCAATVETYEAPVEDQDAGPLFPAAHDEPEPDPGPAWWCCSTSTPEPPAAHDCSEKPTTCPATAPVRWCNTNDPPVSCN